MSATNPTSEWEALMHVVARVRARIPGADEDTVREWVAEELIALDRARVRTYIPALVEGRVSARLRAALASSTNRGRALHAS